MSVRILVGDALEQLRVMQEGSVRCCVTSPPYFGLRDYGVAGQIGLEATPDAYVSRLVEVFREVRRVLTDDGTLWLNLGDSYAGSWGAQSRAVDSQGVDTDADALRTVPTNRDSSAVEALAGPVRVGLSTRQIAAHPQGQRNTGSLSRTPGLKSKDLIGIPWRVAFALQADGWYLRSDIIWSKPNPMPESVTDRPTKAHEYVFLLAKSERYFYDAAAIAEPASIPAAPPDANRSTISGGAHGRHTLGAAIPEKQRRTDKQRGHSRRHAGFNDRWDAMEKAEQCGGTRNKRSVWSIAPAQYREAHFATMPADLARTCILAGSATGDTILDPFGGAGTTGLVADRLGRNAVLIELNPEYATLATHRLTDDAPLFTEILGGAA